MSERHRDERKIRDAHEALQVLKSYFAGIAKDNKLVPTHLVVDYGHVVEKLAQAGVHTSKFEIGMVRKKVPPRTIISPGVIASTSVEYNYPEVSRVDFERKLKLALQSCELRDPLQHHLAEVPFRRA